MFYLFLVVVLIIVVNLVISILITNGASKRMSDIIASLKQENVKQRDMMCSRIKVLEDEKLKVATKLDTAIKWMKAIVVILEEKNIDYPKIPQNIGIDIPEQDKRINYPL